MAIIKLYDPFAETDVDELFRSFIRPARFEQRTSAQIKLDVAEDDTGYTVQAEIPGVNKEDINVAIEGNQVSISAEVKPPRAEKEGERWLRRERYYGNLFRSFTLGQDIDQAASSARYTDGVLELRLVKKAAGAGTRISVT